MATTLPVHPGEHLSEMLTELGISPYRSMSGMLVP